MHGSTSELATAETALVASYAPARSYRGIMLTRRFQSGDGQCSAIACRVDYSFTLRQLQAPVQQEVLGCWTNAGI